MIPPPLTGEGGAADLGFTRDRPLRNPKSATADLGARRVAATTIALEARPQTEAAKRHYAGGSCRGGFQTRPRSAFTVCEVDPSLVVRTSIAQLMTAILSQRACGTRAGLKPAPTSFATAMCFPSGVCGRLSYAIALPEWGGVSVVWHHRESLSCAASQGWKLVPRSR